MYLEHFGLKEPPFALTPDTNFWFEYASHHEALNVLTLALRSGEGFIKVTGEVGLGKTLICRKALNSLGDDFVTAYIPNPHLSPASMRAALADELGLDVSNVTTQESLLKKISQSLLDLAHAGKRVVLCLDEAQELPDPTLEALRLLTNLETEKYKLLQVALFGQPELEQRLNQPHLRQLKQRITFSHVLMPLTRAALDEYVEHRLRVAGYRGAPLFARDALDTVYAASAGTPRLINILCHKAMMAAFGPGARQVSAVHARRAIADTDSSHRSGNGRLWNALIGTGIVIAAIGVYLLLRWYAGVNA